MEKKQFFPLELQSWEDGGAQGSGSTSSFSDTHGENLPRDIVNSGQESLQRPMEFPMLPSEPLDAAIPEAVLPENMCLDFSIGEPINSFDS